MEIDYKAQVTIYVIISLLIVGTIILMVTIKSNFNPDDEDNECFSNNDCVKVQTSCCSCSMGGDEVCVQKINEADYQLDDCPDEPICTAQYNCREESCGCINGKCVWKRY